MFNFNTKLNRQSAELSDQLHDMWFNADKIRFYERKLRLEIDLHRSSKTVAVALLAITEVEDLIIEDREQVGWYDIHHVDVSEDQLSFALFGNIPISIKCRGARRLLVDITSYPLDPPTE